MTDDELYQRCPVCGGKLTTPSVMMVDGLNGCTGPLAAGSNCPCTYSPTPGWAKVGLTMRQVDRLTERANRAREQPR